MSKRVLSRDLRITRRFGLILFTFLLPVVMLAQSSPWEESLAAGIKAMRAGNLQAAQVDFSKSVSQNPTSAEGHLNLGLVLFQQKQWSDSAAALKRSLALKPHIKGAELFLGIDHYHMNDLTASIRDLQRGVKEDPSNADALMWLGIAQLGNGDATGAANSLDAAAKSRPNDVDILYHRGRAHMLVSKASYEQMFHADPSSWRVHEVLAQSFAESNRSEDAILECKLAIQSRPKEPGLHQELGDIYWSQNKLDNAEAEFQNELEIDPESYEAMYKLGVVSLEKSKPEVAARLLTQALSRAPDSLQTHYERGRAEAQLGQYDSAIRDFAVVVAKPSGLEAETVRQSYYQLSRLYKRVMLPAQAQQALTAFLQMKQQSDTEREQTLENKMKNNKQVDSADVTDDKK